MDPKLQNQFQNVSCYRLVQVITPQKEISMQQS